MLELKLERFTLQHAPRRTKVTYTALLVYLLFGLVTIIAIESLKTGWTPQGVSDYYRGNEQRFMFEKSPLEMLEVTHMHLFSVPVVFFILAHAFSMTTLPERTRMRVVAAAFSSVFLSIGSPWLVRFGSAGLSWIKVAADLVLAATLILMTVYPIYEMWWKPAPHHAQHRKGHA